MLSNKSRHGSKGALFRRATFKIAPVYRGDTVTALLSRDLLAGPQWSVSDSSECLMLFGRLASGRRQEPANFGCFCNFGSGGARIGT